MRRALSVVFFVAVIAWAVFLFVRRAQTKTPPAVEPLAAAAPSTSQPPRLALPGPRLDAGHDVLPVAAINDEQQMLREIRDNVRANPQRAEQLAREARQRFPESDSADERDALLVDALINQQRIGAARSETYYYFDHHPNGRFAEHLFVMTGVHPTPHGPGSR